MSVPDRFSKSPFIQQDWGRQWAGILILPLVWWQKQFPTGKDEQQALRVVEQVRLVNKLNRKAVTKK